MQNILLFTEKGAVKGLYSLFFGHLQFKILLKIILKQCLTGHFFQREL